MPQLHVSSHVQFHPQHQYPRPSPDSRKDRTFQKFHETFPHSVLLARRRLHNSSNRPFCSGDNFSKNFERIVPRKSSKKIYIQPTCIIAKRLFDFSKFL